MVIKEIEVKDILTKTNLPVSDYAVNPYVGCTHACKYCYASFMKRFTNHPEPWGEFVDVKTWPEIRKSGKYAGKEAFFCSVTDPYQPLEAKYGRTRALLEQLLDTGISISISTKSDLNSLATLLASAVEGVGLGALGIGMPDIVLFTSVVLRGCYETALRYGFTYDIPEEKYFILTVLEGALLKGEAWDACSERVNALLVSPHIPTEREMKEQLQYTADAFAIDMMVSKFIQGIPVLGVVGGLTNPVYYRKIQQYVRLKYQKRFLMAKSA